MNNSDFDVCVIGAGASGLVAAIIAAGEGRRRVLILEKNSVPGRKLAASGNGRCNLSNLKCQDWERTCGFFSSLGIMTRSDEEGRVYPRSEDGRDVVEALVKEAERLSVEIRSSARVVSLERDGSFIVGTEKGDVIKAEKVLIATGGKSHPEFGTTGDGYGLAKKLGHRVGRLAPSLTGIETEEDVKAMGLSGARAKAEATLYKGSKEVCRERGEVQFTDYGLSGICIFNLSREIDVEDGEIPEQAMKSFSIGLDFLPEMSGEEIGIWIRDRENSGEEKSGVLRTLVKKSIAETLISTGGEDIPAALKDFRFHVKNLRGWKQAQVTKGGVSLKEVDQETMESLLVPGLFFTGEVLDYDGPSGGFNLQFAWTTGMKAGKALAGLDR